MLRLPDSLRSDAVLIIENIIENYQWSDQRKQTVVDIDFVFDVYRSREMIYRKNQVKGRERSLVLFSRQYACTCDLEIHCARATGSTCCGLFGWSIHQRDGTRSTHVLPTRIADALAARAPKLRRARVATCCLLREANSEGSKGIVFQPIGS